MRLALALTCVLACKAHDGEPGGAPAPTPAATPTPATPPTPSRMDGLRERIAGASLAELSQLHGPDADLTDLTPGERAELSGLLWQRHLAEVRADAGRTRDRSERAIHHDGLTMRFASFVIGERPAGGYPLHVALHGGGGAPAELNDSQWEHMKVYYRDSVDVGIYVAVRGASDTWDLHFRPQSYPMLDRLIEDMIAFEGADPNRVYLHGFSAGGDGVYQLTPRTADRWAAVAMSAGHPNGVSLTNVYRVPFLIQVGERDEAYDRHRVAAEYCGSLDRLRQASPDGYVHDCFIHLDRPHNFPDNDAARAPHAVLAEPQAWLARGDRASVQVDTNSVAWVRRHARDPWPARLIWDTRTRAARPRVGAAPSAPTALDRLFYWLELGVPGEPEPARVVARIDRARDMITLEEADGALRILLRDEMLDLGRDIDIVVPGGALRARVRPNLATMARTLGERGDPNLVFAAELALRRAPDGAWSVSTRDP